MPSRTPSFEDYVASLGRLTAHVDPTASSPEAADIKNAAQSLARLNAIDRSSLSGWLQENPNWASVLGLAVGLSQEKFKNTLKHRFDTTGWISLARQNPADLVAMLDEEFDLVRLVEVQRDRHYDFGDILAARAGTRTTATRAGQSGRRIEDEIEAIARDLNLPYEVRTRFVGRNDRHAPCDLAVPSGVDAQIVVAAKGFDSTGSKLTDAVREIVDMADVRQPRQFVMAVIDGIGWKNRISDLRRIHTLCIERQIDGIYTLASLDSFRHDLEEAARLRGL